MSLFETAIEVVLRHEGIVTHDPLDPGGPSRYGISLKFLKHLVQYPDDSGLDEQALQKLKRSDALLFYKTYWWDALGYEHITHQSIATKVLDLSVNMGAHASHRCLQRAIRAASGALLKEDGIFGPKTLAEVNRLDPDLLLAAYRSEAAGHYRSLHQPHFEAGWLNRAYDL